MGEQGPNSVSESVSYPDATTMQHIVGEQGPNSVSESVSYPDATTMQHIVGDAESSGGENGKRSRKPRISETIILNDCSCARITLLFSLFRMKTFTAACYYSFKKCRLII